MFTLFNSLFSYIEAQRITQVSQVYSSLNQSGEINAFR